jgi:hypothetical protein
MLRRAIDQKAVPRSRSMRAKRPGSPSAGAGTEEAAGPNMYVAPELLAALRAPMTAALALKATE